MAIPTISIVSPDTGPSAGDMLVTLTGTNFRVPTVPQSLPYSAPFPTASVLIGGFAAKDIKVLSTTLLTFVTPSFALVLTDPQNSNATNGLVSISVQNLDEDTGLPLAGETVTLTDSFAYEIPKHTTDFESDLARLIRTFLRFLKQQMMFKEITHAVHTDFDEQTGDELHVTKFAVLPGITLLGPELVENRFYSLNEQPTFEDPTPADSDGIPIDFVETRVPYTVDVRIPLMGCSNSKFELLNMMQNLIQVMHHNKFLSFQRQANDPSKGSVLVEMDFETNGQPKMSVTPSDSNLRSFSAAILLRGFDLFAMSGFSVGSTSGVSNTAIVTSGKTVDSVSFNPLVQIG